MSKPKVVILCGGQGTRLREETEFKPKPMIEIGEHPILWHIMKTYASYGFNEFILCLGYKGEMIKDYFYNYRIRSSDLTISLADQDITFHHVRDANDWKITLVDTGQLTMTGGRIKRIQEHITEDTFMLTYGDGVTDLNIEQLLEYHKSHGGIGTVTGVFPPSRYGELMIEGDRVSSFEEKPKINTGAINGGYFVFNRAFFDYLSDDDQCILEREPLERLAQDNQLRVYQHEGFWQCMDTYRDLKYLSGLWEGGNAPWKVA